MKHMYKRVQILVPSNDCMSEMEGRASSFGWCMQARIIINHYFVQRDILTRFSHMQFYHDLMEMLH